MTMKQRTRRTRWIAPSRPFFSTGPQGRAVRRALGRATVWLAMTAAWVHVYVVADVNSHTVKDDNGDKCTPKTAVYYATHAVQIAGVMAAGCVALASCWKARRVTQAYAAWLTCFMLAGIIMAARGYRLSDALTPRILGWTGPFICFISVFAFVGMKSENWSILGAMFGLMALCISASVVWKMCSLNLTSREQAIYSLWTLMQVLLWLAAWLVLMPPSASLLQGLLRWIPLAIYAVGSIVTQTRLNLAMVVAIILAFLYAQRKRHLSNSRSIVIGLGLVLAGWVGWGFVEDTPLGRHLLESSAGLKDRLDEDSRSDQIVQFFSDVSPSELILGRGSQATWNWHGLAWTKGTDVGYLSLLFYGGLPLMLSYVMVHIVPAFRVLKSGITGLELTCSLVVVLWAVRMLSSSFPILTLDYYVVLACVGGCLQR